MRARKPKVIKENSERWLLTYSDLITLLMIFFVLLYAMSSTDTRKFQDLTGALQQAFNNGTYQLITVGGSPGNPKTPSGADAAKNQQMKRIQQDLSKYTKMLGLPHNVVTVGISHEGIVISIAGSLLFYPGGSDLRPASLDLLGHVGLVLGNLPNDVRIEGNTDSQGTDTAAAEADWALSAQRAISVVEYLSEHGGVPPQRLQAMGLGQYHPVASNATAEGRSENRHADIVILYNT